MNPSQREDGLDLPLKIGSYRIEERLGSGGMGVVYRAFDEALRRPLAVKHLPPDPAHPTASRRFRREAQAAARLNHPAIVHIYDIVATPEGDWIVMELVEGTTLTRLICDGSLDLPLAVRLGREIAEGLGEAHAHGIIHRDLKPSNVMITASGHAKILDFGLAKLLHAENGHLEQPDLSQPGIVLGTCHAMSPEQAQGLPLDQRSDLFSFGSLFYEMLTATSPFRGATMAETLVRICSFQQPPACRLRPEVPRELSDLIDRLLHKDPAGRPGSTGEVAGLLEAFETASRARERAAPEESTLREGIAARRLERSHRISDRVSDRITDRTSDQISDQKRDQKPEPAPGSTGGALFRPTRERRQVTVVCCELVGMDRPSGPPQTFDPEFLYELMQRLSAPIDEITKRWDGHLGSILGHRILIYFGYPQAHEDNARRAVRAALELAARVAQMGADSDRGKPISLALRVGVHTGPAVVVVTPQGDEPVTLGATLDLAVELQALAEPGRVVVSPATRSLIGRSFVLETLPPVEVPGLAVPLTPHLVLEPMESEDSSVDLLPLVGREREMELLLSRWALAREGNGQVMLISGEAGIGKSRLVRAVRERLAQDAVPWWSCFASPYTQSTPLQPIVGLLRQALLSREGASPLDQLESFLQDFALADAVPLFARLLDLSSDEHRPAPRLSPQRQREKTLEALAALVVEMAERQPLVLLIEDLHWLDPTTLGWLDHLIEQAPAAPLFLLLTLRLHTLEALWGPRAHLTQITLSPLDDMEAERLIQRVEGEQSLPAAVRRQIIARTDGVPLFLEELTKAVLESHESGARQELPATLRDSLAARLDRLGTAKEVAQVASVIGRVFSFELLAAVCSSTEEELQRELRRLVQAELVYRKRIGGQTRYLFKHALVQDAAYESLLKRERQQIHRQIAETLEARFPETAETTPEILAHHYTEAGVIEPAVGFWVRAGGLASRRSAGAEALGHFERALRLLESLPESPERDRRELTIQNVRATALITFRGYLDPEAERTYARAAVLAERFQDAEALFWAVLGLRTYHLLSGNLAQALPLSQRLLSIAESLRRPGLLAIAWLGLGGYHFWSCEHTEAVSALERACELAPPGDDSYRLRLGADLRVTALSYTALSLGQLGQLDRAQHTVEQTLALARQLGSSPYTLVFACVFGGAVLAQMMRDAETVRQVVGEVYDLTMELGLTHWIWQSRILLAWAELHAPAAGPPTIELGDVDSAQQPIVQMAGSSMAYYFSLHAEILISRRCFEDAWRVLDEGLRLAQAREVPFYREEIYRLQGEILLARSPEELREGGGPTEAERLFQTALEEARRKQSRLLELRAALSLGKLWKSQGRTGDARELVAQASQGFTGGHLSGDLREARAFLDDCI